MNRLNHPLTALITLAAFIALAVYSRHHDQGYPQSQVDQANIFIAAQLDQADPWAYRRYQLEAIKDVYPDDGVRLPEDY